MEAPMDYHKDTNFIINNGVSGVHSKTNFGIAKGHKEYSIITINLSCRPNDITTDY